MTAEVAILNANAIALAADSAVTVGHQKIYNSALKLFALSKVAPVGIMVFGNATLMDVPWETIIKEYRKKLDGRTFATLEKYADDFFDFIRKSKSFFPKKATDRFVLSYTAMYLLETVKIDLEEAVVEIETEKGAISNSDVQRLFKVILAAHVERLEKLKRAKDISADYERKVVIRFKKSIDDAIFIAFEKLTIPPASRKLLYRMCSLLICRDTYSDSKSGVVIAGFGESEIFPSVATYDVEGVFDGRIKHQRDEKSCDKIAGNSEARIIPFAQKDMVASFMEGVSPDVKQFISQFLGQSFARLPELIDFEKSKISAAGAKKIQASFQKKVEELFLEFRSNFDRVTRDGSVDPIMNMVSVLPKDELAAMAEALVNLTAFKRKMSEALETVGGPIDVAVISKGDGLVWVKRKHYFPAELNQHFFANYFRGMNSK